MIKRKIFYGWVIVTAALIVVSTLIGIRYSSGIFLRSLEAEFDLSRTAISSVFAVYTILAGVFAFISGWALDRYGPRLVVSIMGFITGLSLLITSQTTYPWQLFFTYSVLLAMGTGGTLIVLTSIVSRWFYKKRGTALGIASSGAGLGALVMAPFAAHLISNLGWRISYLVLGTIAMLVIIPLAMLLRKDPGQIGLLPDGQKLSVTETSQVSGDTSFQMIGLSVHQSLKTRSFWLILAIWLLYGLCLNLFLVHIVAHATYIGISSIKASTIISVAGVFHLVSRLSIGRISDIIGRITPAAVCAALGAIALTGIIWGHSLLSFYVFAVLFGLSWGGIGVTTLAMVSDTFGERNIGAVMGTIDLGYAAGATMGTIIGGIVFDFTNSYEVAFAIGAVSMLLMVILLTLTRREINNYN